MKIDIVFTWVDSTDKIWIDERNNCAKKYNKQISLNN